MKKGGKKYDAGKLRFDLIPARPIEEIARVMTFGAEKYSERNWEEGMEWGRLFAAVQRHLWAFWKGEDNDPETGYSHLAHAGFCVLALLEFMATHPELDDRPKGMSMDEVEYICRDAKSCVSTVEDKTE